jgi:hypothetical protein
MLAARDQRLHAPHSPTGVRHFPEKTINERETCSRSRRPRQHASVSSGPGRGAQIESTVRAGIDQAAAGHRPGFDVISQLVDLAGVLAIGFEELAVELGTELVNLDPSPRVLNHVVSIVARGRTEASRTFGEYLSMLGATTGHCGAKR